MLRRKIRAPSVNFNFDSYFNRRLLICYDRNKSGTGVFCIDFWRFLLRKQVILVNLLLRISDIPGERLVDQIPRETLSLPKII